MKYIDSEKLKAEIERRMKECVGEYGVIHKIPEYRCLKDILSFVESLQQEQKDYRKLYEDIAKSEWFKKAYKGKSLVCDDEQKEQKPVDWDDELEKCKKNPLYFYDKYVKVKLKSAEWSEEDEKMRNKIIGHLSGFIYPNSLYGEDAKECINWLKAFRGLNARKEK